MPRDAAYELTPAKKHDLIKLIDAGKPLPEKFRDDFLHEQSSHGQVDGADNHEPPAALAVEEVFGLRRRDARATLQRLGAVGFQDQIKADAVIGEGKINFPAVFDICESNGVTQWYVVEHEREGNAIDNVKRCFEAMKKLGKV